jgi:exodeoxyribonuclease V gamma subunit
VLRVYYSNQTEELLCALVETVRADRSTSGATLFDPVHLVVPNRNIETFVKLGTARLEGICAHFETQLLADYLAGTPGESREQTRLLDRLLTVLFDETILTRPELEPVRRYLVSAGDSPEASDRRRVQLATKLARLFSDYEASRPELLDCWRAGLLLGSPERSAVEAWQRRLWIETTGDSEPRAGDATGTAGGAAAHLFGISYFQRAHALALGRLARSANLWVYSLNPCQELWEAASGPLPLADDAPRRYERRGSDLGPGEVFSLDNPFRLANAGEMLPLRVWAKPGRESLRLLNALTGCELLPRMKAPDGTSLLHRLQRDIVLRRPERSAAPKSASGDVDESIVFLECGSVRRELEVIASEIWSLLSRDDGKKLRFNDIALLLVPSVAERYQSLVGSVFGEAHNIPHNIVDLPMAGESRLAEAFELLLALPLEGFTRQSILRFITHPAVLASFPEVRPDDWVRWCDGLGLPRGAERSDLDRAQVDEDSLDWDRELTRLALSPFLGGERSGEKRPFRPRESGAEGTRAYLLEEVSRDEVKSSGSFGLFLRSLLADAKASVRAQMTLPAWMDFLATFATTYLEARSPEDDRVLRKCLRALSAIGDMELGGRKVHYRVARELAHHAVASLSGSRGQYLVDGVVVSSFVPMRAIPFRVVFIAGLGERDFPAVEDEDYLDLRSAHRRAGDVGSRDRDRYLFLETLLATRDRLSLSYPTRDELTSDPLSPSSVVSELRATLLGYVREEDLSIRSHASPRWEDPRTRRTVPEAAGEKKARSLGEHLRSQLGVARSVARLPRRAPRASGERRSRFASTSSASSSNVRSRAPRASICGCSTKPRPSTSIARTSDLTEPCSTAIACSWRRFAEAGESRPMTTRRGATRRAAPKRRECCGDRSGGAISRSSPAGRAGSES